MSGRAEEVAQLEQLLQELLFLYRQGLPLTTHDVRYSMYMVRQEIWKACIACTLIRLSSTTAVVR